MPSNLHRLSARHYACRESTADTIPQEYHDPESHWRGYPVNDLNSQTARRVLAESRGDCTA